MNIILGTANVGNSYGVFDSGAFTSVDAVSELLDRASKLGIIEIDTAAIYGESEKILGATGLLDRFSVNTKLAPDSSRCSKPIEGQVYQSLERLKLDCLGCLLFHRSDDLIAAEKIGDLDRLFQLQTEGLLNKIGVSVYSSCEVPDRIWSDYPLTVQCPYNVMDRSLVYEPSYETERIDVRSVFLQGVLLAPSQFLDAFPLSCAALEKWMRFLENGVDPGLACMSFVEASGFKNAIVGVKTISELEQIVQWRDEFDVTADWLQYLLNIDFEAKSDLIDPRRWNVN